MSVLFGDFETRSAVDLKACGADVYAKDPTTDVLCFGFSFDDEPVSYVTGDELDIDCPTTRRICDHIAASGTFIAHNAPFEMVIWNNVLVKRRQFPLLKAEQVICTMAMAYAMNLPGALEKAAPALGLKVEKDMTGHRIMLQLSRPKKINEDGSLVWWDFKDVPEKYQKLYGYCCQDVVVEKELAKRLLPLSKSEKRIWQLDRIINDRGVGVDLPLIEVAIDIVESEKKRLDVEMRRVTDNAVSTCNAVRQLTDWLIYRGVGLKGVAKNVVLDALAGDGLPVDCREALTLRQQAAKASTAKLQAMKNGASDGRIRGMFQYHGASQTGRWAGRRIQLQNLPRNQLPQESIDEVFHLLTKDGVSARDSIDVFYGPPLQVISDCLRGFLVPAPGCDFIAVDFSAIEARVLAWLAGEEKVLEIFRTHGLLYEASAADIHGVPIESIGKKDPRRQHGKIAELSLGFQGGVGAFQMMAKNYGVKVSDEEAENIKCRWRAKRPNIVRYWYSVEDAAMKAILSDGVAYKAGHPGRQVTFKRAGSFLWCLLPSRRVLCYPYPQVMKIDTPWGDVKDGVTFMGEDTYTRKWSRQTTYGGSLVENCTQAVARDLLAEAMVEVELYGYRVVAHIHDEIVCEVPKDFGSVEELESLVSTAPVWAKDLPVAAEGWRGTRYKKG